MGLVRDGAWVGRLRDGRVGWHGRAWWMPVTEPPHALHGTVLDAPWTVVAVDGSTVTLETGFGEAWPFEASIRRRIELFSDRVVDRISVSADEPMPVILGWHPWFRRRAVRLDNGDESEPALVSVGADAESSSMRPGCHGRLVAPMTRRRTTCSST